MRVGGSKCPRGECRAEAFTEGGAACMRVSGQRA